MRTHPRSRKLGTFAAIAFAYSVSIGASTALAQEPDKAAVAEASSRYTRGTELYKEENYRAALIEFRKAFELTGNYRVQYNIAQVCYQLQDYVCALNNFESYLKKGGAAIEDDRKGEVNAEINKLRPRIGTILISTSAPGAEVTIDDVPRGTTPFLEPIILSSGQHKLHVVKPGKVPVDRSFDLAGREDLKMDIPLVDNQTQVIVNRTTETPSKFTALSWVGIIGGGALVVGGGITGVLALNDASKLKSTQYVGSPSPEATSLQSKVKTERLVSDVLTIGGVITLGTTLVLTLTRNPVATKKEAAKLDVSVGPRGVSLFGEF